MANLKAQIVELLERQSNLTDREITNLLKSTSDNQQPINQICRELERIGTLKRQRRADGLIGNILTNGSDIQLDKRDSSSRKLVPRSTNGETNSLSEDATKQLLSAWLEKENWAVQIAWGKSRGIDVVATRGLERWIIEVKGCGSLQPMRLNYFLAVLGELLQRMSDPSAQHSIAFPDIAQFRGLWQRLPELVKARLGITALFVNADGTVHVGR